MTQNGLIYVGTTYNNKTDIVNASTGALVQQVAMNGGGVFTIDSKQPLHGHLYNTAVYKIPFVSGAYVALSDLSSAKLHRHRHSYLCRCKYSERWNEGGGHRCLRQPLHGDGSSSPGTSAIYECAVSCQTGGTATLVYSDTTGAVSQIAFDPWGNMFFTDCLQRRDRLQQRFSREFPPLRTALHSGHGFAATPTLLQTLTVASPGSYDDQLDGVAVTSNGTIYYADQNDGMFAIPNTKAGGPDTAHQYVVSALAQRVWRSTPTATSGWWSITTAAITLEKHSSAI